MFQRSVAARKAIKKRLEEAQQNDSFLSKSRNRRAAIEAKKQRNNMFSWKNPSNYKR